MSLIALQNHVIVKVLYDMLFIYLQADSVALMKSEL